MLLLQRQYNLETMDFTLRRNFDTPMTGIGMAAAGAGRMHYTNGSDDDMPHPRRPWRELEPMRNAGVSISGTI
jgi:hypothetical protein